MKLNIRYDNRYQSVEVELEQMEGWLNISVGDGTSKEEREAAVQEMVEERINRPEYNSWHKMDRHRGMPKKPGRKEDQAADATDGIEYQEDIAYTRRLEKKESYEAACGAVREILQKKPEWADAVIAVYIEGESIREYAARIGANENNITQKLKRARAKLQKIFADRQIF